jgi:hypothetical protein
MDGKENQPQNISDVSNSAQEQTDMIEILKTLNSNDQKVLFDLNKYQNEEEVKKISNSRRSFIKFIERGVKKNLKEISEIKDSKKETKEKLEEMFSKFQKLVNYLKSGTTLGC